MERTSTGSSFVGMAGGEGESSGAIVEPHTGVSRRDPGPDAVEVRLDQADADAVGVQRAHIGGAAEARCGPRPRRRAVGANPFGEGGQPLRIEERLVPSSVVGDELVAFPGDRSIGLDQTMPIPRVARVRRTPDPLGDPRSGQREVALRVRRDRPTRGTPDRRAERVDPLRAIPCQIVEGHDPIRRAGDRLCHGALVEGGPSLLGDGRQGSCESRSRDPIAFGGRCPVWVQLIG